MISFSYRKVSVKCCWKCDKTLISAWYSQFLFFSGQSKWYVRFFSTTVNILVHGFVLYIAHVFYSIRFDAADWTLDSKIAFTKAEFDNFLKRAVPASIYIGGISLLLTSLYAVYKCLKGPGNKLTNLLVTLFYVSAAFFLFGVSLVSPRMSTDGGHLAEIRK